jgi:hypothetical protein
VMLSFFISNFILSSFFTFWALPLQAILAFYTIILFASMICLNCVYNNWSGYIYSALIMIGVKSPLHKVYLFIQLISSCNMLIFNETLPNFNIFMLKMFISEIILHIFVILAQTTSDVWSVLRFRINFENLIQRSNSSPSYSKMIIIQIFWSMKLKLRAFDWQLKILKWNDKMINLLIL